MIELDQHESEYLKICKHFRAIYDTNSIRDDAEKKKEASSLSFRVAGTLLSGINSAHNCICISLIEKKLKHAPTEWHDGSTFM